MTTQLPKFDAPPVIETVLSVQFERLPNFTGALAGWFWKSYLTGLSREWTKSIEVPRLEDQFELFGEDQGWAMPGFRIGQPESARTQLVRSDEERMVQVQDSRFVLNWKKGRSQYPSYNSLLPEFNLLFGCFQKFAIDAGYPNLSLNQWEVTYVNNLLKGELWNSPQDLEKIFKAVTALKIDTPVTKCDGVNSNWRFVIGNNIGRLYINLHHVKVQPENNEALRLQMTARGPINMESSESLATYFDMGHEAIVRAFTDITTESAHLFWKRTQ